jgi:hypothetical protein
LNEAPPGTGELRAEEGGRRSRRRSRRGRRGGGGQRKGKKGGREAKGVRRAGGIVRDQIDKSLHVDGDWGIIGEIKHGGKGKGEGIAKREGEGREGRRLVSSWWWRGGAEEGEEEEERQEDGHRPNHSSRSGFIQLNRFVGRACSHAALQWWMPDADTRAPTRPAPGT